MGSPPCPNLKTRRSRVNMTQRELARRVGVSASYISHMESGSRNPPPAVASRINRILGDGAVPIRDEKIQLSVSAVTGMTAELSSLRETAAHLSSEVERLEALLEGRSADSADYAQGYYEGQKALQAVAAHLCMTAWELKTLTEDPYHEGWQAACDWIEHRILNLEVEP